MAAAGGQAAGLAVGAAVGSLLGGPAGALAGAQIGAAGFGFLQQREGARTQQMLDTATLKLQQEQARLKAAEQSSIHAGQFRQALASQMALASMRGGAGSLATQFGAQAYQTFMQDQKAIERGLMTAETAGKIREAEITARRSSADLKAYTRLFSSATEGINLNLFHKRGEAE